VRTSDLWPGDLFAEPNDPRPGRTPSSCQQRGRRGERDGGGNAPRCSEKGDEQSATPSAEPASVCGLAEAETRAKDENDESRKTGETLALDEG
jgi:hypothetical protein